MAITTASQSQIGQDTAKNSQVVTTVVKNFNSGTLGSGGSGPSVTSVIITDSGYNSLDETAAATSNSYIRILGTGFSSTSNVFLNGTMVPKANITFTSSSELRAVLPVSNTGNYTLSVFNSNTAGALLSNTFVISTMPQWLTASPLANTISNVSFITSLSATSDSNITYSNTTILPTGTTLLSNGLFFGTISVGATTTNTFDVKATDAELQDTTKTFSLTTVIPSTSGFLYTWGNNQFGQLGLNNRSNSYSPNRVGSLNTWTDVSSGSQHITAIRNNGTLWSWGANSSDGQLGINDGTNRSSPTQVGALTNWSKIYIGGNFSLAIKVDGTLWSWGRNDSGQLGQDNQTTATSPKQVGTDTTWVKAAAGPRSEVSQFDGTAAAIKSDGTLWTWGTNRNGQLGLNSRSNYANVSPNQVGGTTWKEISSGLHVLAIKTDGTLWAWGNGTSGRLGLNSVTSRSSPVQVGTNTNWLSASAGATFSLAIKTDGTLWAWGSNGNSQLGDVTTINKSSPTQIGTDTNWSIATANDIAEGLQSCALALKTNATLWTWGGNTNGQLGLGGNNTTQSPTQVGSLDTWITGNIGGVQGAGIAS
jgi:alpha-tubulin suppressor-like RCC1 family protein